MSPGLQHEWLNPYLMIGHNHHFLGLNQYSLELMCLKDIINDTQPLQSDSNMLITPKKELFGLESNTGFQ